MFDVDVLNIRGEKFAVMPYEAYEKIVETLEDSLDSEEAKDITKRLLNGEEQLFPSDVVNAIFLRQENKIKVFREYRKLSQDELAKKVGKTVDMIKKLEEGKSNGSVETLKLISKALNIDLTCIV